MSGDELGTAIMLCVHCRHPIVPKNGGMFYLHVSLNCPLHEGKKLSRACGLTERRETEKIDPPVCGATERTVIYKCGNPCIYFVEVEGRIGCCHDLFGTESNVCVEKDCGCVNPEPQEAEKPFRRRK